MTVPTAQGKREKTQNSSARFRMGGGELMALFYCLRFTLRFFSILSLCTNPPTLPPSSGRKPHLPPQEVVWSGAVQTQDSPFPQSGLLSGTLQRAL